jgi:hypothetical protein
MKKTILIIGLSMSLLAGCGGNQTDDSQNERYKIISDQSIDGYGIKTIQDKETGCQYILTTGNGTSVHPSVNKNGYPICK